VTEARTRVLVVEDEAPMRRFLRATLESHGYEVVLAETAAEGIAMATQHQPDVLLLDLGLPDGDGLDLTKQIREWSQIPILVVSARGREADKVEALDAGADDYLTKPFGVNELLARLRVALRRSAGVDASSGVIVVGVLEVDVPRHVVRLRGEPVHLTPIEFRLLLVLAKHAGRVLTHRQILHEVWGPNAGSQNQYLRVYMTHLRRKLEEDPARPKLLLNEPGVGYRLRDGE
jgi:two-component system, OmpR family, KDP operon response regulator KdpE